MKWECSSECKILSDGEVCAIIDLAAAFQKPMRELKGALESVDSGCPNRHWRHTGSIFLYSVPGTHYLVTIYGDVRVRLLSCLGTLYVNLLLNVAKQSSNFSTLKLKRTLLIGSK